jgi:hypothetical protein
MGGGGKKRGEMGKGGRFWDCRGREWVIVLAGNWNRMIFRSHSCGTSDYHIGTKAG